MTETLNVQWKPGTIDTLLVSTASGTLEWLAREFERTFGRAAMAALYLRGSVQVTRQVDVACAAD